MQLQHFSVTALLMLACLLVACNKQPGDAPTAQSNAPASQESSAFASDALSEWLGKWTGVEGTYLELAAKSESKYEVIIKDLDRERRFEGIGSADHITFERDGKQEEIRATDGDHTGMKWLAGKTNCLTIRVGEGYCRD